MYTLDLTLANGDKKSIQLEYQHQLTPDNVRPYALVYWIGDTTFNVPFSSIIEFSFSENEYTITASKRS